MPTYDYVCPSCGHEFQKFHKMSVTVRPKCPECGTVAQRQITGGAGLHFKGSGFYATDYNQEKKGEKGEKGEKASGESKSDGKKTETKKADTAPKKGSDS